MRTSENGRRFIEAFEGKFLKTYDDGVGVLTIGYGHTSAAGLPKVVKGMTITDEQCDAILAADLMAVEANVQRLIRVPMTQAQFDALVSFDFNTGALSKGTVDDKINADNRDAAMATLLQYDHGGGKVMPGLTRRRKAEKLMFEGDVAAAMKLAGATMTQPAPPVSPPVAPVTKPPVQTNAPKPGFWASLIAAFTRKA